MTDKQFRILAAVFVVLAAALLFARWRASQPTGTPPPPIDLAALKDSGIDKIQITGSEATTTLEKTSGGWTVGGSAVETRAIQSLWAALSGAKFVELVSRNPANQETFGVSGPAARKVVFLAGADKKAELAIGNPADQSQMAQPQPGQAQSVYVKVGGSKEVWLVSGNLAAALPVSADAWRARAPKPK